MVIAADRFGEGREGERGRGGDGKKKGRTVEGRGEGIRKAGMLRQKV